MNERQDKVAGALCGAAIVEALEDRLPVHFGGKHETIQPGPYSREYMTRLVFGIKTHPIVDAVRPGPLVGPAFKDARAIRRALALSTEESFVELAHKHLERGKDSYTAGLLAGATVGMQRIPSRLLTGLPAFGLTGFGQEADPHDWEKRACRIENPLWHDRTYSVGPAFEPREVLAGVWASSFEGLRQNPMDREMGILSFCRVNGAFPRYAYRREYSHMMDNQVLTLASRPWWLTPFARFGRGRQKDVPF